MYAKEITQEMIDIARAFHGHWCPGLCIGIRVAAYVRQHLGFAPDEELVCIAETDMCGVDAIQALTGCTLGKGNLIFKQTGKVAFTFFRRSDGKKIRLVLKPGDPEENRKKDELRRLLALPDIAPEKKSELEKQQSEYRKKATEKLLSEPFEQLFWIKEPQFEIPPMAFRCPTVICEHCGEGVMSTYSRTVNGATLCQACAEKELK